MFAPTHPGARIAELAMTLLLEGAERGSTMYDISSLDRLQSVARDWPGRAAGGGYIVQLDETTDGHAFIFHRRGFLRKDVVMYADCWLEPLKLNRSETAFAWSARSAIWIGSED